MTQMPPEYPALDAALLALLEPVPGDDPCGPSVRGESLFTDIRLAREEEDPHLPMRQWERPLKVADWAWVEARCAETLQSRSKDLQLAAWLAEAWTRQGAGVAGLARGLLLLRELLTRYWEDLHPRPDPPEEGGCCEARIAVLDWLGEHLAHTLRVHVCLFPLAQRKPASVSLADWERLIAGELAGAGTAEPEDGFANDAPAAQRGEPALTRDEIMANVRRHAPGLIETRLGDLREARAHLVALLETLDLHLGPEAPHLRKLAGVLEAWERVLLQVGAAAGGAQSAGYAIGPQAAGADAAADSADGEGALDAPDPKGVAADPPFDPHLPVATAAWRNREEAYRTLEALSRYLASIEPHSPTPYLIRRAVNWGRLPLPELMAEIMQEEGDLNRMVQLLGLGR